jgi:MoaA/NifB/PqqE/SkfB family radical SAM enzyme
MYLEHLQMEKKDIYFESSKNGLEMSMNAGKIEYFRIEDKELKIYFDGVFGQNEYPFIYKLKYSNKIKDIQFTEEFLYVDFEEEEKYIKLNYN